MGLTHYTAHTVFVFVCISICICQTTFVSLKKVDYSGEIWGEQHNKVNTSNVLLSTFWVLFLVHFWGLWNLYDSGEIWKEEHNKVNIQEQRAEANVHYTAPPVFVFVCICIYICQTTFVSLKKEEFSYFTRIEEHNKVYTSNVLLSIFWVLFSAFRPMKLLWFWWNMRRGAQ